MVKIILQTLNSMGFERAKDQLQAESGVQFENEQMAKFRQVILLGQWTRAIELLQGLKLSKAEELNALILIHEYR